MERIARNSRVDNLIKPSRLQEVLMPPANLGNDFGRACEKCNSSRADGQNRIIAHFLEGIIAQIPRPVHEGEPSRLSARALKLREGPHSIQSRCNQDGSHAFRSGATTVYEITQTSPPAWKGSITYGS
jgi:hypothetical protein